MQGLAHSVRSVGETILSLFDLAPPSVALTVIAIVSGVGMLWVFGKTTHQKGLERARDRMVSAVYEVRLFPDSLVRMWKSIGRLLGWGFGYIGYTLPAILVLAIPLVLMFVHLDIRYGQAPLEAGETTLVKVTLADGVDGSTVQARPGAGYEITAPPLWDAGERTVYLRLRVTEPGTHTLVLDTPRGQVEKVISADPAASRVSAERRSGLESWIALGYEPPLEASSGVETITLAHPYREDAWLGIPMPWWIYWLIVSMATAFALRKPMGVVL